MESNELHFAQAADAAAAGAEPESAPADALSEDTDTADGGTAEGSAADGVQPETKAQKKARKLAEREAGRQQYWAEKRRQRRQRDKNAKRKLREAGLDVRNEERERRNALARRREEELEYAGRLVIDCGWEALMDQREMRSLGLQLQFLYAANLRAARPLQLHCTGFGGRLAAVMATRHNFDGWKLNRDSRSYMDVFDPKDLVYLTSEASTVLTEIDPTKCYIIGGLVDHNKHKGVTFEQAQRQGIATAQLPIGDNITLNSRKVLAVNHVGEILLHFAATHDWAAAFEAVIPQRKGLERKHPQPHDDAADPDAADHPAETLPPPPADEPTVPTCEPTVPGAEATVDDERHSAGDDAQRDPSTTLAAQPSTPVAVPAAASVSLT
eukprot:TRINITY_DN11234_c0_g1_i1.p1 TRINITY_DN11234_c0_g1~~TRINITY_DN11234_c0_g1_i1.p1  ORF type:complete len:383 (-),score=143.22 TRINITY_DN11234_c0_g1_i1:370-1518(-)